jgi:hypothetical protein
MPMAVPASEDLRRVGILSGGALILAIPMLWIGWSLAAASEAAEAVRIRSDTLASLRDRLTALEPDSLDPITGAAGLYLPGATAAIAGAALQRVITASVEEAGGRVAETEVAPAEASEDASGGVDLRVSLDTDIVGLQRILFKLETGLPILILDDLSIQAPETMGEAGSPNPVLHVVMRVRGYLDTQS